MRRMLTGLMLLIFGCSLTEFTARQYLSRDIDHIAFRRTRPAPYVQSPYWSQEFIDEQASISNTPHICNDISVLVRGDFAGKWYNIRDGIRHTTGQPEHYDHTVYMFGTSTIVSLEVPDAYTIPSYLQRMLPEYRVMNYGGLLDVGGAIAALETAPLKPGDIVIYYSGVSDAYAVYFDIERRELPTLSSVRLWQRLTATTPFDNPDVLAKYVDLEVARYERGLAEAKLYTEAAGARFVNVLQPILYSKPLSEYEQMLHKIEIIPYGLPNVYRSAWPYLQQSNVDLDLTHTLDELRGRQDVYLDCCHVVESAHEVIARAIADALR